MSTQQSNQFVPPAPKPRPGVPTSEKLTQRFTDVSRSDLPPMPNVYVAPPTSPYAALHTNRSGTPGCELFERTEILEGSAAEVAQGFQRSLTIPSSSTARAIPARVLIENRQLINDHLSRTTGGTVTDSHLLGYALVEALAARQELNVLYQTDSDKPAAHHVPHVALGVGTYPQTVLREADRMTFDRFWKTATDMAGRAERGELNDGDTQGATASFIGPDATGTDYALPRLHPGQTIVVGAGVITVPAQWAGASTKQRAAAGIGEICNLTVTFDPRVIRPTHARDLLHALDRKIKGEDGYFERVFEALRIPIEPLEWAQNQDWEREDELSKSSRITELIHAYRSRGHLAADTDPLHYRVRRHPDLKLSNYGLSIWDLDRQFPTGNFKDGSPLPLREILEQLRDTYSRSIGIEYMHIQDPRQRHWMQERIEQPYRKLDRDKQRRIMRILAHAEAFETFLQTKYMGQKRFSLEGGESLIALLDNILFHSAKARLNEVTIGMAHRGRLNVLANICGKSYSQIFSEFEGNPAQSAYDGSGDVKYHLGTSGTFTSEGGHQIRVYLGANPSHLEAADGVLEGITRAKQDAIGDEAAILPILIHGDAAFAGQGVVYETLNMSQLAAYRTGGTIHVIVNNQIGFTTGPTSARSTAYCTDLAKGLQVPIFHVNADAPESVVRVARLAWEYRQAFHKDVIIDMVCYRRRGHNEGDDPSMTQPIMYAHIDALPSTRQVYVKNLIGRGDITEEQAQAAVDEYKAELNRILNETRANGTTPALSAPSSAKIKAENAPHQRPETGVSHQVIERIGSAHGVVPEGFTVHPKLAQLLSRRQKMATEGPVDWGFGELLAFGSLLLEGTDVRMSGEDSRRGTFVQRQAVLHDRNTGREWTPLANLARTQGKLHLYDSSLSEYAPMAFEYGYSVENAKALVVWEAQFGDFANGAQTVMDEFISSAEQKWGQRSSVVLMLPHGYEGQGPDHSSARIERYLQLCAQDNMIVAQPSTPANHFHLLRAQAKREPRKPLILFTPKQLLRLPAATSPLEDFTRGRFQPVITEDDASILERAEAVRRVVLCTGRLYYDLRKARYEAADRRTALVRIEQLYPLPQQEISQALCQFPNAEVVWAQDEPENQGAWWHMKMRLEPDTLQGRQLRVISRAEAASTSAGTMKQHTKEAAALVDTVFDHVRR